MILSIYVVDAEDFDETPKIEKEFEGGFDDLEVESKNVVPQSQPKVETGKIAATGPSKTKKRQLLKEAVERKEAQSQVRLPHSLRSLSDLSGTTEEAARGGRKAPS